MSFGYRRLRTLLRREGHNINHKRRGGSLKFGIVQNVQGTGDLSKQGISASGQSIFEPPPQHRGNVARSLLYFGLQYGYISGPSYTSMLQQWAIDDPVDQAERDRQSMIHTRQGNENPLVICSRLAEAL